MISRGDGRAGQDWTHHAQRIAAIPKTIAGHGASDWQAFPSIDVARAQALAAFFAHDEVTFLAAYLCEQSIEPFCPLKPRDSNKNISGKLGAI